MARISPSEEYKIIPAPFDSPLFEHVRRIRIEVFVDEQKYPLEDEFDDNDPTCIHVLLLHRPVNGEHQATPPTVAVDDLLEGYEPAGTLRCLQPPKNKIGRVAVLGKFRGKGLGGVMMKGLEAMLRGQLADTPVQNGGKPAEIVLHAQVPVVPFYKGLGYDTEGDEFLEDGTPHIVMRKQLLPLERESLTQDTEISI